LIFLVLRSPVMVLLGAALLVVLLSWLQYLYVRLPRPPYVWSAGFLIASIVVHILGLWGYWVETLGVLAWSVAVQWVFYWLFFRRFPADEK